MKRLGLAVQLMTRWPLKKQFDARPEDYAGSTVWFFFTGLMVGLVMAGVYCLTNLLHVPYLAAFFSVIAACLFTGGFHVDGFADMCDAFFARKDRERTLEILKDSRMGTYGVLAIVFLLAAKTLLLGAFPDGVMIVTLLVAMPVCGKVALLTCAAASRYAREDGLGKYIIDLLPGKTAAAAILLCGALCVTVYGMWNVWLAPLLALAAAVLVGWLVSVVSKKRIGGATGDILGAANELGEIVYLIVVWGMLYWTRV